MPFAQLLRREVELIVAKVEKSELGHVHATGAVFFVLAYQVREFLNHVRPAIPRIVVQLKPIGDFISYRHVGKHDS